MKQQWTRRGLGAVWLLAAAACGDGGTTGTAGSGVATAGTGAPAPAAAAGSSAGAPAGAAGSAPTATGPFACEPASGKAPAELYTAAAAALVPADAASNLPCAFGSCHNASKKAAQLAIPFGANLAELVGKASCEAPTLSLVAAGGGSAALSKSWLYLKLASPVDGTASLIPDPSWGEPGQCGQMSGFGVRMPVSSGADGVGDAKLAVIREWICAGAPGAQ